MSNFGIRIQIEKPIAEWYGSSLITKLMASLLSDELSCCGFKLERINEKQLCITLDDVMTGVIGAKIDTIALVITCHAGREDAVWLLTNRFVNIAHNGYN